MDSSQQPLNKNKLRLSIDLRILSLLLLIALLASIAMWRPWENTGNADDRTVRVTGTTTLKAAPDEFNFYPMYQFENANKDEALAALTEKSNEVVAGLKDLGVSDDDIKTNSNGFENTTFPSDRSGLVVYNLQLTVTVDDQKQVQKIQDYLVSTDPTGSVSPAASFSETKRKELESKGRSQAIADARKKADQTAEELGFKVNKVKSVDDTNQNLGVFPIDSRAMTTMEMSVDGSSSAPSLGVQSGKNELSYSVTVVYYIK